MSKATVQHLLQQWHIRPDDEQGQHFLVDDTVLERIATSAKVSANDHVLEVGPGIGNLTAYLSKAAGHVAIVEIDPQFKALLEAFISVNTNTRLLYGDILKMPFAEIAIALGLKHGDAYKIVANIPYYLTSRFFATVLKYTTLPERIVVLIQKEVAERITAGAGDQTKLSLSIQMYGRPKILFGVPRTAFNPTPAVDSAVLSIEDIHSWNYSVPEKKMWQLITFGFSSKRKKLINNLMAGLRIERTQASELLEKAGIFLDIRAEDMKIEEWIALTEAVISGLGN